MLYENELDEMLDNESFLIESNVDVFSIEEEESDTAYIKHCLECNEDSMMLQEQAY